MRNNIGAVKFWRRWEKLALTSNTVGPNRRQNDESDHREQGTVYKYLKPEEIKEMTLWSNMSCLEADEGTMNVGRKKICFLYTALFSFLSFRNFQFSHSWKRKKRMKYMTPVCRLKFLLIFKVFFKCSVFFSFVKKQNKDKHGSDRTFNKSGRYNKLNFYN